MVGAEQVLGAQRGREAPAARLWQDKVRPLIEEAADMLAAVAAHGTTLLSGPGKLAELVGEADAALLLSGQPARGTPLASLGPVLGLTRLARGEIPSKVMVQPGLVS